MITETETEFTTEEEPPSSQFFNNWKWQLQHSISTQSELEKHITLTQEENDYFNSEHNNRINFRITPYYLFILKQNEILRKTMIPSDEEFIISEGEEIDSLHEDDMSPIPNLVWRYPNRVLLLVTEFCSCACRFCTRSRKIKSESNFLPIDDAINFIKEHKEIEDVIASGGDIFTLPTFAIKNILKRLSEIEHLKVIRLGTKVPICLPMRFDDELLSVLEEFSDKLWINIHVTHPCEITDEVKAVAKKLTKLAIPLGSQTVLLKNVNNDAEILKKLFMDLVAIKIIPRYLYQMDLVSGTSHFRTKIEEGLDIMQNITGFISGMAVPKFVCDAPSGGGKVPLLHNNIISKEDNKITIKNWEQKLYNYYE
jgi:lysine 2,3-aminomutase